MTWNIRESTVADLDFIQRLIEAAFDEAEGPLVAELVRNILNDPTALPVISLVAEADGEIIGNILFSKVKITGPRKNAAAYILAPLAVAPKFQRKGVGKSLIENGLAKLRARGTEMVFVYGDPNYYSRSGFEAAGKYHLVPPYALDYPDAWMVLELNQDALSKTTGTVQCASSLSSKAFW